MKLDSEEVVYKIAAEEIVILGICRNVENDLESEIHKLLEAFSDFSRVYFRIVESDSSDGTIDVLERLKRDIFNFDFVSLGSLESRIPSRIERIAYCRNVALDLLKSDSRLQKCSYVAVSDLDGVNNLLTREGVLSCWTRDDWGAVSANQLGPYYDIYALRHSKWSPNDCWRYEAELIRNGMNPISARQKAVYSRQKRIPITSPWIEVESAFGGLAIYRAQFLKGARYSGMDPSGKEVCEHVSLHTFLKSREFHLYINPRLINHGWNEHSNANKMGNRIKRLIKLIIYSFFKSEKLREKLPF